MHRTRIRRTMVAALLIGVAGTVIVGAQLASASGGGGCGRTVSDARGTRIRIHQFCFTPTIPAGARCCGTASVGCKGDGVAGFCDMLPPKA